MANVAVAIYRLRPIQKYNVIAGQIVSNFQCSNNETYEAINQ